MSSWLVVMSSLVGGTLSSNRRGVRLYSLQPVAPLTPRMSLGKIGAQGETMRYSHQFAIAVTVESDEKDPEKLTEGEFFAALRRRVKDIRDHDKFEAFQHLDTEEA